MKKHIFTLEEIKEAALSFENSALAKEKYERAKHLFDRDIDKLKAFLADKK
jgi:hypothetical protein